MVTTQKHDTLFFFPRVTLNCHFQNSFLLKVMGWNVVDLGHVVVVLGEVGELLICLELHLVVVVAVLCHGCSSYPT